MLEMPSLPEQDWLSLSSRSCVLLHRALWAPDALECLIPALASALHVLPVVIPVGPLSLGAILAEETGWSKGQEHSGVKALGCVPPVLQCLPSVLFYLAAWCHSES